MVHVVGGYIVYHYCVRVDRGEVHVVVAVMLSIITVYGLTEEWFMLLVVIISTITT